MNSLLLKSNEMKITEVPEPKEVLLPLKGFTGELKVKEGAGIVTGEEIAPGIYSTVTGTVKRIETLSAADVDLTALRIEVSEDKVDPAIKAEANYLEKDAAKLLDKLNRANLSLQDDFTGIETVIVGAVDMEPLSASYQQFLRENPDTVVEGLKLIKHLTSAKKVILALPEPLQGAAPGIASDIADVFSVPPVFPNGLPEILARDVGKKYGAGKTAYLKIETLIAAVSALQDGKPFTHKVLTVVGKGKSKNVRVRIGTPVKDVLQDMEPGENGKVIIGGPMMGNPCYDTETPITGDVDMVYVQESGEVVKNENNQCMNCGKCVNVCPAHLSVNLISRYSEFSLFEQCGDMGIQYCIECGLCAYYCPSGRSLVQFIRLAKAELEKIEAEEIEAEKIETEGEDVA